MTTLPSMALAAVFLLGAPSARAEETEEGAPPSAGPVDNAELESIFALFNHRRHEGVLEARQLGCPACHSIGSTGDPRLSMRRIEAWAMPPPPQACHYCHNPASGEPPAGTGRCIVCHDDVEPPESHGAGWIDVHGVEARLQTWSCENCHRDAFCIDCHERRESARYLAHDREWLTLHGIAAWTDPSACGTCHLQADCVACHRRTDGRLQ